VRTTDLQYELPPERIAQQPVPRRDASRLLVLDRRTGRRHHESFRRMPALLPAGSLLVMNDTGVLPARLRMRRRTGGRVEGLFLREAASGSWEIMLTGSGRLKVGEELAIDGSMRTVRLRERLAAGTWRAEPVPGGDAFGILTECGRTPLPPYIKRDEGPETGRPRPGRPEQGSPPSGLMPEGDQEARDAAWYQTIYARQPGAVAAPTAGLHFTPAVFDDLRRAGMGWVFVTLHVGVGTFAPIRCDELSDHEMHAEWYDCPAPAASAINIARSQGRPIVAVGTTSVRVLETCADETGHVTAGNGWTRLFIYPPYRFRIVDAMLTNFHLPASTLLAMVFAFAGRETILAAYEDAVRNDYRFYSYGDAMLIV